MDGRMRLSSLRIKKFRNTAILAGTAGFLIVQAAVFESRITPVHAASGRPQSAQTSETQAPNFLGTKTYARNCAICHGDQREGILPGFPPLVGIQRQMKDQQIIDLIHSGKGRMPAFPKMPADEMTALLHYLANPPATTALLATTTVGNHPGPQLSGEAAAGGGLFLQNCAFCHGRDAMGGETGPDLTQSKLVETDTDGSKISEVVRNGRPEKKMPAFNFSSQELLSLVAFIRAREVAAASMKGNRRGVAVSDLQTGNVQNGKQYFNGAGGCSKCHSPTGDLAGIARRYEGLHLEERMLYPRDAKSTVVVTLSSGEKISGTLAYLDEFTVGLRDSSNTYRSWPTGKVKYTVDSPVEAHVDLFSKYTDADIHNLMAYLQTLR
jgi:mono/diheme cytochrome c family protein